MELVQVRVQWRSLVLTMLKLRVLLIDSYCFVVYRYKFYLSSYWCFELQVFSFLMIVIELRRKIPTLSICFSSDESQNVSKFCVSCYVIESYISLAYYNKSHTNIGIFGTWYDKVCTVTVKRKKC